MTGFEVPVGLRAQPLATRSRWNGLDRLSLCPITLRVRIP